MLCINVAHNVTLTVTFVSCGSFSCGAVTLMFFTGSLTSVVSHFPGVSS